MPRVAIFGAGVGGLSTAHQLSQIPGYQIDIYEKKDVIGGLARSDRDQDGCATEYCWRVYFDFYNNLFKTMAQIPINCTKNQTVLNNLTVYRHTNIRDTPFSFADSAKGVYNILKGFSSCDQRLEAMDNVSWHDALLYSESKTLGNPLLHIGGWLGMDRMKGSYKSVVKVGMEMQIFPSFLYPGYKDWITTLPTSEAWFDPWLHLLKSRGVRFHFNSSLTSLSTTGNKVQSAILQNGSTIIADHYVLAIPIESLASIVQQTPQITLQDPNEIIHLRDTSLHTQLSYQIYFNRPISLGPYNAFLIVDSPWDLIVLSYDTAFSSPRTATGAQTNIPLCTKIPQAKGGWSVAACTAYTPGILFHKPMNQCTEQEIYAELWAQMARSKTLQALVSKNNGFGLTQDLIVKWSPVWSTFQTASRNSPMTTSEPKFTNNVGSSRLRPSYKTRMNNLYIATGYIKETIDIFSMESANIAGRRVAHAIDSKSPQPFDLPRPLLFMPLRALDTPLYCLGLPDAFTILLLVFFLLTLFAITRLI